MASEHTNSVPERPAVGFRLAIPTAQLRVNSAGEVYQVPVFVFLCYEPTDAIAVRLHFRVRDNQWVAWVFARDLLIGGLTDAVGDGCVRVRPTGGGQDLRLTVHSADGAGEFELSRVAVVDAVNRMLGLVPVGTEHQHIDWDRELGTLTGRE